MIFPVVFREAALTEFHEAAAYYETQRLGLGVEFTQEVERSVARIAQHPHIYPTVYDRMRRVTVRRFPFMIYFYLESHQVTITSIFHSSRNPMIWRDRN